MIILIEVLSVDLTWPYTTAPWAWTDLGFDYTQY